MIEFSEAFKKRKNAENIKSSKPPLQRGQAGDSIDFSSLPLGKNKPEDIQEPRPGVNLGSNSEQIQRAISLYEEGLGFASGMVVKAQIADEQGIRGIVKKIIDFTKAGDQELIEAIFAKNSAAVSYQAFNLLNVCVLSVQLGLAMRLAEDEVFALGISAFIHDAGILRYKDMIHQDRKFSDEEYEQIKKHPALGRDMVAKSGFGNMAQIADAIEQEHERLDGSGYPKGRTNEQISEFARMIGFLDVYEALTHQRPWRESYDTLRAIKIILSNKERFDKRVIKLFLEHIGLYPKGVMVELNTKEVARVLSHNPGYPMAPAVRVLYDMQGKKLLQPRDLDLSKKATIHITKCL